MTVPVGSGWGGHVSGIFWGVCGWVWGGGSSCLGFFLGGGGVESMSVAGGGGGCGGGGVLRGRGGVHDCCQCVWGGVTGTTIVS